MSQVINPPPLETSEIPTTDKEGEVSTTPTAKRVSLKPTVRFLVHFGEMALAMLLGMVALGILNTMILVPRGFHLSGFPEVYTLVMAFAMTVPMALWMWVRGHCWRHSVEMAAAMFVPAGLLIGVYSLGLLPRMAMLSWYHLLMWIAMLGVMLFRWNDYAGGSAPMLNKALLALAVLLCVAVLSAFTGALPQISLGHPHPFATTVKTTDGKFNIKLDVTPNQSGTNVFTVTVMDAGTGQSVTNGAVSLSTSMPKMPTMGTDTFTLHPDGKSHFSATGDFSMGGPWQIRVQLHAPDGALHEATVSLVTSS
jgi:flagellar biosynthetic protein FliP